MSADTPSLAGRYVLVGSLFRDGVMHASGTEVLLGHEDAERMLAQQTAKPVAALVEIEPAAPESPPALPAVPVQAEPAQKSNEKGKQK
ncbi:MAG TPA: hypothetical protein VK841_09415 [Polyangiaceae bacterium]|jgi:hypothetical protein|nr:hypothetical protein [Polyangiaceae bacterium]